MAASLVCGGSNHFHIFDRDNEADMIEKIAMSISSELNSAPSGDSDNLVGINAHMSEMDSLLCLESNEVKMVGIWGPAGIGKTTVARALFKQLSVSFQHSIFVENFKGSYRRTGLDEYGFKLRLQEQFLSEVIDHKHMKIHDLGLVKERLQDLKVLVVLDDVDRLEQLDALVKQSQWFGPGIEIFESEVTKNQSPTKVQTNRTGMPTLHEQYLCVFQGTAALLGIFLDISTINEWFLNERSFGGMHNLMFLKFYKSSLGKNQTELHLPRGLDYLPRKLRLLHWDTYPTTSLPLSFRPEFLVVLNLRESKLEKLWEGEQPLRSLTHMDLSMSENLKEIPDLSKAVNMEELCLSHCSSLVMLPPSVKNLNKLVVLEMECCSKLESIPKNINLESLSILNLDKCSRLTTFPDVSSNIGYLSISETAIEQVPETIMSWPNLAALDMSGCTNLKTFPCLPNTIEWLDFSRTEIEEVPSRVQNLYRLSKLLMNSCMKLRSISSGISRLENIETLDFLGCKNVVNYPVEIFESSPFCHNLVVEMGDIQTPGLPRPFYFRNSFIETIPDCITRHCKLPFLNSSRP
ncbi:hypothetical protein IGI04_010227, partial [Brassica rapa subsp. trilocularis]